MATEHNVGTLWKSVLKIKTSENEPTDQQRVPLPAATGSNLSYRVQTLTVFICTACGNSQECPVEGLMALCLSDILWFIYGYNNSTDSV